MNLTLLFLRASFAREEFFGVPLQGSLVDEVPDRMLNLLLSNVLLAPSSSDALQLKSFLKKGPEIEGCLPRLRILLQLASADLITMLTLALRDSFFPSPATLRCDYIATHLFE